MTLGGWARRTRTGGDAFGFGVCGLVVELDVEADRDLVVPSVAMMVSTDTGVLLMNIDSATQGRAVHLAVTTRIGSGAIDMVESAFRLRVAPAPGNTLAPSIGVVTGHFRIDHQLDR